MKTIYWILTITLMFQLVSLCITFRKAHAAEVVVVYGNLSDEQRAIEEARLEKRNKQQRQIVSEEVKRIHELNVELAKIEVLGRLQMLSAPQVSVSTGNRTEVTTGDTELRSENRLTLNNDVRNTLNQDARNTQTANPSTTINN